MGFVTAFLALFIVIRTIRSLLRNKISSEVWAYLNIVNYQMEQDGFVVEKDKQSRPITHWENVVGRGMSCDIRINDPTVSKNQGLIMRNSKGQWSYKDLGSKNASYINDVKICDEGQKSPIIEIEYGDVIRAGLTEMYILPISIEEQNNNRALRNIDNPILEEAPSLAALTLFQILTAMSLWMNLGTDGLTNIALGFGGLIILMWLYVGVLRSLRQRGFEMEILGFFLSTLGMAVVATSALEEIPKQLVATSAGVLVMFVMCLVLRDLNRAKIVGVLCAVVAVILLILNLSIGTFMYGAKNWLVVGGIVFQPSELVKVAFIWVSAATLEQLFEKKNLWMFMAFAFFCFACLGLMGDFGTALIFFVTFLVIAYLRSGDLSNLILMIGIAIIGGFLIIRFKPYVANRFASFRHIWEADFINGSGYQQTRTLSATASGGLFGAGAGNGWFHNVSFADTDMVFGVLTEEWGLIIGLLAIVSILALSVFSIRSITSGRSTFYTIIACGASTMIVFQTMLNVFGSVDLLPFTGVTFPFVSNGGTSMIVSWAMLAFLKSADNRERASIAVKRVRGR